MTFVKFIPALAALMLMPAFCRAQQSEVSVEKVHASYSTEIQRKVETLDIDGKEYSDVLMTFKSGSGESDENNKGSVAVKVKSRESGKTLYSRRLKHSALFIFSTGQIQVGRQNFRKVVVYPVGGGKYKGEINEMEGVYNYNAPQASSSPN